MQTELALPPQNLTAERSVLGSILLDNKCFDDVCEVLRPEYFYADVHQIIFQAVAQRASQNGPIDTVILAEILQSAGKLDDIGGVPYLIELLESVPHAAHAVSHAEIIRDKWLQRGLQTVCQDSLRVILHPTQTESANHVLEAHEQAVFDLTDKRESSDKERSIDDILGEALTAISERMHAPQMAGLSTGFTELDRQTNGLRGGQVMILAARPSMGKTAFICNIADWLMSMEKATLIFSLEQSKLELAERLLCIRAKLDGHAVRRGALDPTDRDSLLEAANVMRTAPLWIDDTADRSMAQIKSICRRTKRQKGLDVVIIDYLQLIEPEDRKAIREVQVATISRRLKGLAKDLDVPVICLSQLNRSLESRDNKRPRLADLRESGAIEQDADIVAFLHRPEVYDPEDRPGLVEVVIAKHRSGPPGIINLQWVPRSMIFSDAGAEF